MCSADAKEPPVISVIVPFYNSQHTLLTCLESLSRQTLKGIEIVLVDDGSTDDSLRIAKKFASEYDGRCIVLHQDNSGPSVARNSGLDCATGRYIAFVDSDDVIDQTMFEKMVDSAEAHGSDIVSCGKVYVDVSTGEQRRTRIPKYEVLDGNARTNPSIVKRVGPLMCDKIFRRSLIEDHSIRMDSSFSHAEDFLFISRCKLYTDCVSAVAEPLYQYNIGNPNSISGGNARILDIPRVCQQVIDLYVQEGIFDFTKKQLLYVFLGYYLRKCDSVDPESIILKRFKRDFQKLFWKHFGIHWIGVLGARVRKDYKLEYQKEMLKKSLPVLARIALRLRDSSSS